jgi:hypothetical protein
MSKSQYFFLQIPVRKVFHANTLMEIKAVWNIFTVTRGKVQTFSSKISNHLDSMDLHI